MSNIAENSDSDDDSVSLLESDLDDWDRLEEPRDLSVKQAYTLSNSRSSVDNLVGSRALVPVTNFRGGRHRRRLEGEMAASMMGCIDYFQKAVNVDEMLKRAQSHKYYTYCAEKSQNGYKYTTDWCSSKGIVLPEAIRNDWILLGAAAVSLVILLLPAFLGIGICLGIIGACAVFCLAAIGIVLFITLFCTFIWILIMGAPMAGFMGLAFVASRLFQKFFGSDSGEDEKKEC